MAAPLAFLVAALSLPAHASMCSGSGAGCLKPADPPAPICYPGPEQLACKPVAPEEIKKEFEEVVSKQVKLKKIPRIEVALEHEWVTFDCTQNKVVPGPANAEYKECDGRPVISVGRSLVNMSLACEARGISAKQVRQAWARHEAGHGFHNDFQERVMLFQNTCARWGENTEEGRKTAMRILNNPPLMARGFNELDQSQKQVFVRKFIDACMAEPANAHVFNEETKEKERKADEFSATFGAADGAHNPDFQPDHDGRSALECAMQGAAEYVRGHKLDAEHDSPQARLGSQEERRAQADERRFNRAISIDGSTIGAE